MDDRVIDLVAENIDVALRLGMQTDSALKARTLAQAERLVVASAAYLARRGVPLTPADLLEHDCIIYGQVSGGQEWVFRRGTSETSDYLRTRLKLSATDSARRTGICDRFGLDVCAGAQIRGSGERPRRMDAASHGSLGHLSLGPVDECEGPRLHKMVRKNH